MYSTYIFVLIAFLVKQVQESIKQPPCHYKSSAALPKKRRENIFLQTFRKLHVVKIYFFFFKKKEMLYTTIQNGKCCFFYFTAYIVYCLNLINIYFQHKCVIVLNVFEGRVFFSSCCQQVFLVLIVQVSNLIVTDSFSIKLLILCNFCAIFLLLIAELFDFLLFIIF